jgi:DUF971 family protein
MTHVIEMRSDLDTRELELAWSDGSAARIPHRLLRARCRCAECRQDTAQAAVLQVNGVVLIGIVAYGADAVRLKFSDGHDAGIFPFDYLRELARETARRHSVRQATAGRWRPSRQYH